MKAYFNVFGKRFIQKEKMFSHHKDWYIYLFPLFKTIIKKGSIFLFLITAFTPQILQAVSNPVNFRRHFIILHDNSGSFHRKNFSNSIDILHEKLIKLFHNELINDDYNNLFEENQKQIPFFDKNKDEISFFWFVAPQSQNIDLCQSSVSDKYIPFVNYFITHNPRHQFSMSWLPSDENSMDDFLKYQLNHRPENNNTPERNYRDIDTYSFSAFAFPCVLEKTQFSHYAKEYIILIISDFLSGSDFGNKEDAKILRYLFGNQATAILNQINLLENKFFRIKYFDYDINTPNDVLLGIMGFKLKPNSGLLSPENTIIKLNSDVNLLQTQFESNKFIIEPVVVNFSHNPNLTVHDIYLEITQDTNLLLRQKIATQTSEGLNTTEGHINITIDSNLNYRLPPKSINLPGIKDKTDLWNAPLTIKYIFNADYDIGNNKSMGYSFDIERTINAENFTFLTQLSKTQQILIMTSIVLTLGIIVFFILLIQGKPKSLKLRSVEFTDSYETIDYSEEGRGKINTPYMNWTDQDEEKGKFHIKVRGEIIYGKKNRFYNWKENTGLPIRIRPLEIKAEGFNGFIEYNGKITSNKDFAIDIDEPYGLKKEKYIPFEFNVVFEKKWGINIDTPKHIFFGIEAIGRTKKLWIKSELSSSKFYEFYVGPELGNLWVGIDPGTTGSCIATATNVNNITIEKIIENKIQHDKISPSVIAIDTNNIKTSEQIEQQIENSYIFGFQANSKDETETRKKFVSLKKLLGYKDNFILHKTDDKDISVSSTFLSSLLINGLLKDHATFIENNKTLYADFCNKQGKYSPKRIAMAIPNNFTATKIQHLKECLQNISTQGRFKFEEIRFIYEAEAILTYYLNCYQESRIKQESPAGEIIFVFDMGGATINATIARIKQKQKNSNITYDIDVIGKLGYNIGGDTIDYAFIKWLYSFKEHFSSLKSSDPFTDNETSLIIRKKLKEAMVKLKSQMIDNEKNNMEQIITRQDITSFGGLDLKPTLDVNGSDQNDPIVPYLQRKKENNLLASSEFQELIWGNIHAIVQDITSLCKNENIPVIDTVIFSGRSTHFPRVTEIVKSALDNQGYQPDYIQLDEYKSKSAVALGACYYGIQKEAITLKNITTNSVFGVRQTIAPQKHVFHKLINLGEEFSSSETGLSKNNLISGTCNITREKKFAYDGLRVNFYQVMGINAQDILDKNEKHKFTVITSIPVNTPIEKINISITEKDQIICSTKDENGDTYRGKASVRDAEINDCNDQHYTFFIK